MVGLATDGSYSGGCVKSWRVRARATNLAAILAVCTGCFASTAARAQDPAQSTPKASTSHKSSSSVRPIRESFPPLEVWREAVLAGNKEALSNLYSSNPPAQIDTSLGKGTAEQDVAFWANAKTAGLKALDVKMMEKDTSQGVTQVILRMYLTIQTSSGPEDFVVGGAQAWAPINGNWQIVYMKRGDPVPRPKLTLPEPAVPNPNLYPEPSEAPKEIEAAVAAAKLDHKNVILVFGGNWCFDCHVLDDAFRTSPTIAPLVRRYYHVVHVNIGNYDANQEIADRYQVSLKKGVPALAVLDSDGKILTSTSQGEFESAVKIGPADVASFLNKWKPSHAPSATAKAAGNSPS